MSIFSGELKIAEVASRFTDVEEFQTLVGSIGFRLKSKVTSPYTSSRAALLKKNTRMTVILILLFLSSKRFRAKARVKRSGPRCYRGPVS